MTKVFWGPDAYPISVSLARILYDIQCDDKEGLLLDSVTIQDIEAFADEVFALDALITPYNQLQRKMQIMERVLQRASGSDFTVTKLEISAPFKKNNTVQVAALFTLSDGQTISIFFHNPDATPNKLTPTDILVAWKWMLNKKDITLFVAPENGKDVNVNEIAKRVMRVAERNRANFARAQARSALKQEEMAKQRAIANENEKEIQTLMDELKRLQTFRAELEVKVKDLKNKYIAVKNETEEGLKAIIGGSSKETDAQKKAYVEKARERFANDSMIQSLVSVAETKTKEFHDGKKELETSNYGKNPFPKIITDNFYKRLFEADPKSFSAENLKEAHEKASYDLKNFLFELSRKFTEKFAEEIDKKVGKDYLEVTSFAEFSRNLYVSLRKVLRPRDVLIELLFPMIFSTGDKSAKYKEGFRKLQDGKTFTFPNGVTIDPKVLLSQEKEAIKSPIPDLIPNDLYSRVVSESGKAINPAILNGAKTDAVNEVRGNFRTYLTDKYSKKFIDFVKSKIRDDFERTSYFEIVVTNYWHEVRPTLKDENLRQELISIANAIGDKNSEYINGLKELANNKEAEFPNGVRIETNENIAPTNLESPAESEKLESPFPNYISNKLLTDFSKVNNYGLLGTQRLRSAFEEAGKKQTKEFEKLKELFSSDFSNFVASKIGKDFFNASYAYFSLIGIKDSSKKTPEQQNVASELAKAHFKVNSDFFKYEEGINALLASKTATFPNGVTIDPKALLEQESENLKSPVPGFLPDEMYGLLVKATKAPLTKGSLDLLRNSADNQINLTIEDVLGRSYPKVFIDFVKSKINADYVEKKFFCNIADYYYEKLQPSPLKDELSKKRNQNLDIVSDYFKGLNQLDDKKEVTFPNGETIHPEYDYEEVLEETEGTEPIDYGENPFPQFLSEEEYKKIIDVYRKPLSAWSRQKALEKARYQVASEINKLSAKYPPNFVKVVKLKLEKGFTDALEWDIFAKGLYQEISKLVSSKNPTRGILYDKILLVADILKEYKKGIANLLAGEKASFPNGETIDPKEQKSYAEGELSSPVPELVPDKLYTEIAEYTKSQGLITKEILDDSKQVADATVEKYYETILGKKYPPATLKNLKDKIDKDLRRQAYLSTVGEKYWRSLVRFFLARTLVGKELKGLILDCKETLYKYERELRKFAEGKEATFPDGVTLDPNKEGFKTIEYGTNPFPKYLPEGLYKEIAEAFGKPLEADDYKKYGQRTVNAEFASLSKKYPKEYVEKIKSKIGKDFLEVSSLNEFLDVASRHPQISDDAKLEGKLESLRYTTKFIFDQFQKGFADLRGGGSFNFPNGVTIGPKELDLKKPKE